MRKVMLIDRDREFCDTTASLLRDSYSTAIATSVFEAMQMLRENLPDVILLNYEMLEDGNTEWFDSVHLSGSKSGVPVIFLSDSNDRKMFMEALSKRPEWYILKPPSRTKLIGEIEKALNKERRDEYYMKIKAESTSRNDISFEIDGLLKSMGL